ncbi:hypothetical protein EVJ58_g7415 [Rhodofomes roseus]|uniref:F-box domain-containing protein n=1 Tax=Rhodofomes roseus TaxID=34475 RepID=A0A4Y9Y2U7_9APHY|nr:hypothetical protein EVJ58_g7415 [Rhodofomes roseus]
MHRCLRIPELAQQIVDSLVPTQDERVKDYVLLNDQPVMSALARLARTSKTFQNYALSKLWETQFGIQNLVLCMPDDLFYDLTSLTSVAGAFIPYRFIHFKRALEPRDWARFDYYAQFIKYLGCPP